MEKLAAAAAEWTKKGLFFRPATNSSSSTSDVPQAPASAHGQQRLHIGTREPARIKQISGESQKGSEANCTGTKETAHQDSGRVDYSNPRLMERARYRIAHLDWRRRRRQHAARSTRLRHTDRRRRAKNAPNESARSRTTGTARGRTAGGGGAVRQGRRGGDRGGRMDESRSRSRSRKREEWGEARGGGI